METKAGVSAPAPASRPLGAGVQGYSPRNHSELKTDFGYSVDFREVTLFQGKRAISQSPAFRLKGHKALTWASGGLHFCSPTSRICGGERLLSLAGC